MLAPPSRAEETANVTGSTISWLGLGEPCAKARLCAVCTEKATNAALSEPMSHPHHSGLVQKASRSAIVKQRVSVEPNTTQQIVPSMTSTTPRTMRVETGFLLTCLDHATFTTNWMASMGTSTEADANVKAAKLSSEPVANVPIPTRHVWLMCGFACTSGDDCIAVACRFCPTLMSMEPKMPIRIPTTTELESSSCSQWLPLELLSARMWPMSAWMWEVAIQAELPLPFPGLRRYFLH